MKTALSCLLISILLGQALALGQPSYVLGKMVKSGFRLAQGSSVASIVVDRADFPGVWRAAASFKGDFEKVTGHATALSDKPSGASVVFAGTIGKSAIIDRLIAEKKIDVSNVKGTWESFLIQVVANPVPGVSSGLIIAGS